MQLKVLINSHDLFWFDEVFYVIALIEIYKMSLSKQQKSVFVLHDGRWFTFNNT